MKKKYRVYEMREAPMIRLNNNILKEFGFESGNNIMVEYLKNKIIIEKISK